MYVTRTRAPTSHADASCARGIRATCPVGRSAGDFVFRSVFVLFLATRPGPEPGAQLARRPSFETDDERPAILFLLLFCFVFFCLRFSSGPESPSTDENCSTVSIFENRNVNLIPLLRFFDC